MSNFEYLNHYNNPHAPGCPWFQVTDHFGAPDVKWCEQTLCQWISEPANTWSNVGYFLVAIYFWTKWKNHPFLPMRLAPLYIFLMGFFSFIYHASNFYPTQLLDFLGMFICLYNLLIINLHRLSPMSSGKYKFLLGGLSLISLFIMHIAYINAIPVQLTIMALVGVIFITEYRTSKKEDDVKYHKYFFSLASLLIAVSASFIDHNRIGCDPHNHWLQGHAVWHLFTALMIFFAHLFYQHLWEGHKLKLMS